MPSFGRRCTGKMEKAVNCRAAGPRPAPAAKRLCELQDMDLSETGWCTDGWMKGDETLSKAAPLRWPGEAGDRSRVRSLSFRASNTI